MRRATQLLKEKHPEIEADGEMQGDTALSAAARKMVLPHSKLEGEANIMIMPTLDTANVAYQMIKSLADALPVGPILIGPARPAHILTPSVTARGILNMTAVAVVGSPGARGAPAADVVYLRCAFCVSRRRGRFVSSSCPGVSRASTFFVRRGKSWMAGSSPAMTPRELCRCSWFDSARERHIATNFELRAVHHFPVCKPARDSS